MSKPMKEDWWWAVLALGLLRELEERENQHITREAEK